MVGDCFGGGMIHFVVWGVVAGEIVDEGARSRGKMVWRQTWDVWPLTIDDVDER